MRPDFVRIVGLGTHKNAPTGANVDTVFLGQVQGKVALMGKENVLFVGLSTVLAEIGMMQSIVLETVNVAIV